MASKNQEKANELRKSLRGPGDTPMKAASEALEKKGELATLLFDEVRNHKLPAVRKIAVTAAPKVHPEGLVELLRSIALDDEDDGVSAEAALTLTTLKPTLETLTALVDLILTGRGRWGRRDAGRPPLPWHKARESAFLLIEKRKALLPALVGNSSLLMELESDLLESSSAEERKRAARILGAINAQAKVSVLLRALEDRTVRGVALASLVELKAAVALAPAREVFESLKDETERAHFQKCIRALERATKTS